jgi:hypothetical protein
MHAPVVEMLKFQSASHFVGAPAARKQSVDFVDKWRMIQFSSQRPVGSNKSADVETR